MSNDANVARREAPHRRLNAEQEREIIQWRRFLDEMHRKEVSRDKHLADAHERIRRETRMAPNFRMYDRGWGEEVARFESFVPSLRELVHRGAVKPEFCSGFVFGVLYRLGDDEELRMVARLGDLKFKSLSKREVHMGSRLTNSVWIAVIGPRVPDLESLARDAFAPISRDERRNAEVILLKALSRWTLGHRVEVPWAEVAHLVVAYGKWRGTKKRRIENPEGDAAGWRRIQGWMRRAVERRSARPPVPRGVENYLQYFHDGRGFGDLKT